MKRRAFLRWLGAHTAAAGAVLLGQPERTQATGRWWSSLVFGLFENHGFTRVVTLPSHRRLAREGTLLARYAAVAHPSGPNYRAMISGQTWGQREVIDTFHPTVASAGASATPPIPTYVYHLAGQIPSKHDPVADLHAPVVAVRQGLEMLRQDLEGALPAACLVYVGWDDSNKMHNGFLPVRTATSPHCLTSSRRPRGSADPTQRAGARRSSSATMRTTAGRRTGCSPPGGDGACIKVGSRTCRTTITGSAGR